MFEQNIVHRKFHKLLIIGHFVWGHIVSANNRLEYNYKFWQNVTPTSKIHLNIIMSENDL